MRRDNSVSVNIKGGRLMSDQYKNDECLEWLDAMEIGFDLSDYDSVSHECSEQSAE